MGSEMCIRDRTSTAVDVQHKTDIVAAYVLSLQSIRHIPISFGYYQGLHRLFVWIGMPDLHSSSDFCQGETVWLNCERLV